ncbi:MAG: ABC transporter ATP-binding protein [Ruminococcus sp.]|nr:ABC transporter ATP-binding protein [Ruminococcus sp.]
MIELKNIVKTYNKGRQNEFEALHGISAKIEDGELVAIIGRSGAGKSTLLHILACIDGCDSGEYLIDGAPVKGLSERRSAALRNEKLGMVMQDFALIEDFTALENVLLPLNFSRKRKKGRRERALSALRSVGIEELAKKPCSKLSGGQKQRVAIARAIVNDPALILADEPTGALDTATSAEIMELFRRLNETGRTVVIVTHDPKIAEQCGRVIEICDGRVLDRG